MDIETRIETVIKKNPGIKAALLLKELGVGEEYSRSTLNRHFKKLVEKKNIVRENGYYWLKDQKVDTDPLKMGLTSRLFSWWEERARRKQLERERESRRTMAPALAYFRHRAEVDGVRFWKYIVEEEEKLG